MPKVHYTKHFSSFVARENNTIVLCAPKVDIYCNNEIITTLRHNYIQYNVQLGFASCFVLCCWNLSTQFDVYQITVAVSGLTKIAVI